MNSVQLIGRLTKDIDLRYTQAGIAVGTFTLAVNRNFKNQQGEREADFIRCVIWRKSAENFAQFTRKGSLVGVEGRIQTRSYDNEQGQRVYMTEVVIDEFHLLEPKSTIQNQSQQSNNYSQPQNNPTQQGGQGYNNQPQQQTQNNNANPFENQQQEPWANQQQNNQSYAPPF